MGAKAAVLGASGFTGGEVLRLLALHPAIELGPVAAGERAGSRVADVHPHLTAAGDRSFQTIAEACAEGCDVCFSCLPSGRLRAHLDRLGDALVIDLADDFRGRQWADRWVYGLTEMARPRLVGAERVANPGCYPTASLLALVPFARAGLVSGPVVIDAMSGVSGAGRKSEDDLLFASLDESMSAYGSTSHRHIPEMERGLLDFGGVETTVSFTPHLVPLARGLLVTARVPLSRRLGDDDSLGILREAYGSEAFVEVVEGWPATKALAGTNRVHLTARVDARAGMLVCSAALDNLGKGAAGQAVQNANVALGLEETAGLEALGVWP